MTANDFQRNALQSVEAEQSVIGALLIDNDAVDRIAGLRVEHFSRGDHRAILAEVFALLGNGIGADVMTVFERLNAKGKAEDIGGLAYLNALAWNTPSSANIARYAEIVRDRWVKRSMVAAASEIQDSVAASADSASVLLDRAAAKLEQLAAGQQRREARRLSDALVGHLNTIERRHEGKEKVISTGLIDLDKALNGGFRPGANVVLAARPGMGKTAMALNFALAAAETRSVLFLSMEMPESEIVDRAVAQLGKVALQDVMNAPDDPDFWSRVMVAAERMRNLNLFIDEQGGLTLLDVRNKARAVKRKHGLDLMIVDYLQLMTGEGDNRNEQVSTISRGLKSLAKELDIAIVTLSQLNRKVEERASRMPQASDLRDSGAIEQDADVIIFIHREEVANPDCGEQF